MYPQTDTESGFKYPDDRLLPLRDTISEDLMRHPDTVVHDGGAVHHKEQPVDSRHHRTDYWDLLSHPRVLSQPNFADVYGMVHISLPYRLGVFSAG